MLASKLWPNPLPFTQEGNKCTICPIVFGPEGGFTLSFYRCMYHLMCFIGNILTYKFCATYKVPYYECLYNIFDLTIFMLLTWEQNSDYTSRKENMQPYGEDLLWNWCFQLYSVFKFNVSSQLSRENDHKEIVRV